MSAPDGRFRPDVPARTPPERRFHPDSGGRGLGGRAGRAPARRRPWIGLLELREDVHRRGLGREAAQALADWYRGPGVSRLRVGVDDGNGPAAAFWRSLGYRVVDRRKRPSPKGMLGVDVVELDLHGAAAVDG